MDRKALIAAMQQTAAAKPVAVTVPAWGTLYVRQITVGEVEEQTADTAAKDDKGRLARAAARVLCTEDGTLMFDAKSTDDVALLAAQPWNLLRKVLEAGEAAPNA